ncbi:Asp23/Gls24 family envelope stress response protein [Streptomyces erythrochromogenes]|uniref:Asp23/Gls24 family envelope stress response protein n=1 Tax=Streptomyces erythrochromogenes TaxID=285574 RepID=UPI0033CA5DB2
MTTPRADAVSAAVTDAVLAVPGVACLRPGLRGLLHAAVGRPGAVRVVLDATGSVRALQVEIVARSQHRAADVARAVRAAAAEAAAAPPAAVRITVTGIV